MQQSPSLYAKGTSVFYLFTLLYPNGPAEIRALLCRAVCEQMKGTVPAVRIGRD